MTDPTSGRPAPAATATTAPPRMTTADFRALLARDHPFATGLGIDIVEIGYGTAHAVLPAQPAHRRLGDIVAGPMLMGLADVALYAAVVGATGQAHAVTATLTINFLQKCPARDVHAHARLLKVGRSTMGEVALHVEGVDGPVAHIVSTWAVPA
ncbi:PaaI family thioesterase [Alcaligenaceae bacterium A4P071]|nr:PaaI family thioesterase [Alcaligenaceae bacterium C4P045]MDQ2186948.1 PaaI family thioesterase [Alcaligenaceae bacterium A4P071]